MRALWWVLVLGGCSAGGSKPAAPGDTDVVGNSGDTGVDNSGGTGDSGDTGGDMPDCHAQPAAADRDRLVLISHPYTTDGDPSSEWEVLGLDTSGALSLSGQRFSLGRAVWGLLSFSPDGQLGVVPQEDGSLGIITVNNGVVQVVATDFGLGDFYASQAVVAPDGHTVWVVDGNWRNNGGGIYEVQLACDGSPSLVGQTLAAKSPHALVLDPADPSRAFVPARDLLGSGAGDNAFLVDLLGPSELAGGAAFPDDDAIVSHAAWAGDYGLIADNAFFSGSGNRLAVVSMATMAPLQLLTGFDDPAWVLASPFDNSALVLGSMGDAIYQLSPTGSASAPYAAPQELSYSGAGPALPSSGDTLTRGSLKGLSLIAENVGVRRVWFRSNGSVEDVGPWSLGSGLDKIVGAIGVQP